jgi:tetratricopeptide (TPR) repeat protein
MFSVFGVCMRAKSLRTFFSGSICALWVALSPAATHAEESSDPAIEAEYQQVISDALTEYERGSWEESAALFRRAHELLPSARTLRGLGLAAYEARRYPESIRFLTEALIDQRRPLTAKQREEIDATLERARLFVGYLHVQLEPSDATLSINGQEAQPSTDGTVITDIGWVDLEAKADGRETLNRRIRMNAGDHQELQLRLAPLRPDGEMRVAGRAAGDYVAGPAPTRHDQPEADSPYETWKWVSGGFALAALGTGAAFLVVQKVEAPDYEAECVRTTTPASSCERRQKLLGGTLWTGSIVGFAVGAGLAALSVGLFVLDAQHGTSSDHARTTFGCTGQGELGVSCAYRF